MEEKNLPDVIYGHVLSSEEYLCRNSMTKLKFTLRKVYLVYAKVLKNEKVRWNSKLFVF